MSRNHHHPRRAVAPTLRFQILERDGWQCVQCGKRGRLECDHIVPLHHGGHSTPENLQALCVRCHIIKTKQENRKFQVEGQAEWEFFASDKRRARR